ncbi:MAG: EamA family transporter [Acidobacteriota bacterium]
MTSQTVSQRAWKTRVFAAFVVLSNSFGNLFIALGMRQTGEVSAPADFIGAIFQPLVILGISLLIAWLLTRMAMLSWADLSYVLPVTAFGYVLSAVLGMLFQSEVITAKRWAGIALIVAGVVLVGSGDPHKEQSS